MKKKCYKTCSFRFVWQNKGRKDTIHIIILYKGKIKKVFLGGMGEMGGLGEMGEIIGEDW